MNPPEENEDHLQLQDEDLNSAIEAEVAPVEQRDNENEDQEQSLTESSTEEQAFVITAPPPPPMMVIRASRGSSSSVEKEREKEDEGEGEGESELTLEEELARNATRLRHIDFVEPAPATQEDQLSELRKALVRRSSVKAESAKDDLEAVITGLNAPRFKSVAEVAQLLQRALKLQGEMNIASNLRSMQWPSQLIDVLRTIVRDIQQVEGLITKAQQLINATKTPIREPQQYLSHVEITANELVKVNRVVNDAAQLNYSWSSKVPLNPQQLIAQAKDAAKQMLFAAFHYIFEQHALITGAGFKVVSVVAMLELILRISRVFTVETKELRVEALARLKDLKERYNPEIKVMLTSGKVPEYQSLNNSAPREDALNSSNSGAYALHVACAQGALSVVQELLAQHKASNETELQEVMSRTNNRGRTPIASAIVGGHDQIVSELLKNGADATIKDDRGNTGLQIAVVISGGKSTPAQLACVKMLLEDAPTVREINSTNLSGETALHIACRQMNVELVRLLIGAGADLGAEEEGEGSRTPLQTVALKAFRRTDIPVATYDKSTVALSLSEYFMQKTFSDVVFDIAGNKYSAHKIILCAQSATFRSMLEGHWRENNQNEIVIEDVDPTSFYLLLQYLYTGTCTPNSAPTFIALTSTSSTLKRSGKVSADARLDILLDLLGCADRFLLEPLKLQCEAWIANPQHLRPETAFAILTMSQQANAARLQAIAARFILQHYHLLDMRSADTDQYIINLALDTAAAAAQN